MGDVKHTPVPGWAGYYITPDGRVYSATGWRGAAYRELNQSLNYYGYPSVRLTAVDSGRTRVCVHSLVARTFLSPRPSPKHEVRHLDGNKLNNTASNLAWGTAAENAADRARHGRTSRGPKHGAAIRASGHAEACRRFHALGEQSNG